MWEQMDIVISLLLTEKIDIRGCGTNVSAKLIEKNNSLQK